MAADAIFQAMAIPGLDVAPTIDNLRESSKTYNQLPQVEQQLEISEKHLQNVSAMIKRYNLEELLGVHLIHAHDKIDSDILRVEASLETMQGSWSTPRAIEHLDLNNIHGNTFMLLPDKRFIAYEYAEGPPPSDLAKVERCFFSELAEYLCTSSISSLVGIEVRHAGQSTDTIEFEMKGGGTILLPRSKAVYGRLERTTGWVSLKTDRPPKPGGEPKPPSKPDGKPKPGTHYAATTKGTHKVFVDCAEPKTEEQLIEALVTEGVLARGD